MIIFSTPGLIDPRAFTIGGLSAKVTDNPIGRFGTGLKYAIACLVRMDADVRIYIGRDEYQFVKKQIEFRGKDFDLIEMRLKKWSWRKTRSYDMPFTTEYGKNWRPWQIFRELEANTRDENGETIHDDSVYPVDSRTLICVDHPDFEEAYSERDTIFLPSSRPKLREEEGELEQYEGESKFLYWRGMRVLELGKPSLYTYNFTRDMQLTEDRTLASEFLARTYLAEWLSRLLDRKHIEEMVTIGEEYWESGMDFTWATRSSVEFRAVAGSRPDGMLRSARAWADLHEPLPRERLNPYSLPWEVVDKTIVDEKKRVIFAEPPNFLDDWKILADAAVEKMNEDWS